MLGLGSGLSGGNTSDFFTNAKSLALDGVGDYLNFGDNLDFGTGAFSISLWFNCTDLDARGYQYMFSKREAADTRIAILINASDKVQVVGLIGGAEAFGLTGASALTEADHQGKWVHVVAVTNRDGNEALYINGTTSTYGNTATTANDSENFDNTGDLIIGKSYDGGSNGFGGKIDEVAIFNVALDADAVAAIYNSGKPFDLNYNKGSYDNSSALRAYWRMFDNLFSSDNDEVSAGTTKGIIHDAHDSGLGPELWVASEPLTAHVSGLGSNTAAIEDGAYKITYGGTVNGFSLKFQNTGTGVTSTDLTVGAWYKCTADWKLVGTGGDVVTARIYSGQSWNALEGLQVSHGNDFVTKTIYFKASHATSANLSLQANFSSGETVYLKNVSLRRLNGYPGVINADATSSTDVP